MHRFGVVFGLAALGMTAAISQAQTTQPTGEQVITIDGSAHVTIDDQGVHVTPATTQPSQPTTRGTKPTTRNASHVTIRMSGNSFNNNGGGGVVRTVTATEVGKPADNPLIALSADGIALLKKRGVPIEAIQAMKAVVINGNFQGANRREIVNADPNLVVIFGKDFKTHGSVQSAGPIVATDDAMFMGGVKGDSIVWFADESFPRGDTAGSPVICGPKVSIIQAKWVGNEVWIGKYGWGK